MKIAVQKILDKYGVQRVAKASGIPFWTLRKWRDTDRIPGEGVAHELRATLFKETIDKLKAEDAQQDAAA
jgi:hypothetical protein